MFKQLKLRWAATNTLFQERLKSQTKYTETQQQVLETLLSKVQEHESKIKSLDWCISFSTCWGNDRSNIKIAWMEFDYFTWDIIWTKALSTIEFRLITWFNVKTEYCNKDNLPSDAIKVNGVYHYIKSLSPKS